MKHYPEPWTVIEYENSISETSIKIVGSNNEIIADNEPFYSMAIAECNARRIVACVNACNGLQTDALEQNGLISAVGDELLKQDVLVSKLECSRRKLSAALKACARVLAGEELSKSALIRALEMARDALADSEGEAQ